MEEILAAALKSADAAEVFWVKSRYTPVSFEANRLKHLQTKESCGASLRVIKNGQIGFSATNRIGDVEGLVNRSLEVCPYGAKINFDLPGMDTYPRVPTFDAEVQQTPIQDMVQLGQSLVDGIRTSHPDVLCDAGVSQSEISVRILNSEGLDVEYRKSVFSMGVGGTLVRGTDMLFVGDWQSSCKALSDPTNIISKVNYQLDQARDIAETPSGKLPVIFTPDAVAGLLLSPLLIAFNGKSVIQGSSPLTGKIGKKLFDERISIHDDSTVPMRPGSRPWDDEGVPSRKLPLIKEGVLQNFIYDLKTAAQAGVTSTGNASRGGGSPPSPSTSVILIKEGDTSFDEMVADVSEGLVVDKFLGAGQTNILAGDFNSNVLLGYKIEKGKVVGRVKNSMLSGNVYDALNNLVAVGNKAQWRGGSLQTPPLYCRDISVAKTES